jgi:uncharacterized protein (TIGR02444 family)
LVQHDRHDDDLQYDNDFWRFSLAVYGQPEIAEECLSLQQAHGVDINLLLFCAWLGTRGAILSSKDLEDASGAVSAWNEGVVRPLRGVRQWIKARYCDEFGSIRERVKGIELEAEQIEQAILLAFSKRIQGLRAGVDRAEAVARNVDQYLRLKSGPSQTSAPLLIKAARRIVS